MTAATLPVTGRAVPLRRPVPEAPASLPRRILWVVPQRRSQAARTPFVVVLVVLLIGGLLGLLLLNTMVAQESFALHDLAKQGRALQQQEQELTGQLQAVQAPGALAVEATKLGMVPGGAPAFLRLSDGRVLGQPTAGKAVPVPRPAAQASPQAAKPAVTPAAKPTAPTGSTTWTAPRQSPPPATATGAHR